MMQTLQVLFLLAFLSPVIIANSGDHPAREQADAASFKTPPTHVRPRFRYWLPDASVDPEVVKADIKSAGSIGAGGIELVPFFQYGGRFGSEPPGANWTAANFGTPAFQSIFRAALQAHEEAGLLMDFAVGPNQGQGVPASRDDEGLQWDLVPFTQPVDGESFTDTVPGWGTGDLVAVVSAEVLSETNVTISQSNGLLYSNITYNRIILKSGTLLDQTDLVSDSDGKLEFAFPSAEGTRYRIFAFYQKRSLNQNVIFHSATHSSIFDDGSYVVDHFSKEGAETVARFWRENILTDEVKELLSNVGHYGWEDSSEILSNISWSRSMPARFEKLNGYSLRPYLPLLAFQENNIVVQATEPGSFQCILDTEDEGVGFIHDFRAALLDGYREYLTTLKEWVHSLGLQLSAQPGYNLPLDMLSLIPEVDAPECESLGFLDVIDEYRQFSGPANLAGRQIISNEMGAVQFDAYRYTMPKLLFSANRAYAGGVNQLILHGQSYTGDYYATTWPGYVAFGYLYSDLYNDKQPYWNHGLEDVLNYMARLQLIQQKGIPRLDVAIYNKQSGTNLSSLYEPTDLVDGGWSYTYISPDNFAEPFLKVHDNILAPEGPAWKALVIQGSDSLTVDSVAVIQQFAEAGLPIILSGGIPRFYSSGQGLSEKRFQSQISNLMASNNVHMVEAGGVASLLSSIGLRPSVEVNTTGVWYTTWRVEHGTEYALVYADLVRSSGYIRVATTKKPYFLDLWSGERTPVAIYEQSDNTTTIPLNLNGNQTIAIAFTDDLAGEIPSPAIHVTSAPSNVIGYGVGACSSLNLYIAASTTVGTLTLSNGKTLSINSTEIPGSFQLSNWTLTAEHWEAPSNISDATATALKYNTTHYLASLVSWTETPELTNVSGVGYYSTTFSWPPSSFGGPRLGATLTFPGITHAIRLYVNGLPTPPLDISNAISDITPYLVEGNNEIMAVVPTTLWNYLRTVLGDLSNAGAPPMLASLADHGLPMPGPVESGLVEEVVLTPYLIKKISAYR